MNQNGLSQHNLSQLIEQLAAWAAEQAEIEALYLYGSVAEGRANQLSDVDIALLAHRDLDHQRSISHWDI